MSKRIAITVSDEVAISLAEISKNYGASVSSIGAIAIMDWLEKRQATNAMKDISDFSKLMQNMAVEENNKKLKLKEI